MGEKGKHYTLGKRIRDISKLRKTSNLEFKSENNKAEIWGGTRGLPKVKGLWGSTLFSPGFGFGGSSSGTHNSSGITQNSPGSCLPGIAAHLEDGAVCSLPQSPSHPGPKTNTRVTTVFQRIGAAPAYTHRCESKAPP